MNNRLPEANSGLPLREPVVWLNTAVGVASTLWALAELSQGRIVEAAVLGLVTLAMLRTTQRIFASYPTCSYGRICAAKRYCLNRHHLQEQLRGNAGGLDLKDVKRFQSKAADLCPTFRRLSIAPVLVGLAVTITSVGFDLF